MGKPYLFPLTSNSFKYLTHHRIMVLNPTAMFNEKPMFAADPGLWIAPVPYTRYIASTEEKIVPIASMRIKIHLFRL